ncbi:MAG TPA: class I SAM-dependent methyltransferase [Spongiibacteraceae bacterium]|nr:class I SAM-dependent methyltransferase [Spongiibacteraceae bacterium]
MLSRTYLPPRDVYRQPAIIADYLMADYLEASEKRIINLLGSAVAQMRMLDIAIGAGRTTRHFAPLVREYVGLDYSEPMIDICKRDLAESIRNAEFFVADMRDLSCFRRQSFDFVLISYNAIGAMSHEDRQLVYREVNRVCKPGGYFFFSAHNLQSVDELFGLKSLLNKLSPLHPKQSYWRLREWFLRRLIYNSPTLYPRLKRYPYCIFNDGAHGGLFQHYYITPAEQIRQLEPFFEGIRIFGRDGHELAAGESMVNLTSAWLFYLCNSRALNVSAA